MAITRRLSAFANAAACTLFALFAYLQINDPDAVTWASMYFLSGALPSAFFSIQALRGDATTLPLSNLFVVAALPAALAIHAAPAAFYSVSAASYESSSLLSFIEPEPVRELTGALLVIIWLMLHVDGDAEQSSSSSAKWLVREVVFVGFVAFALISYRSVLVNSGVKVAAHCRNLMVKNEL